jgi:hypothetical protein
MLIGVSVSADEITLPAFPDGNSDFADNVYIGIYNDKYQVLSTTGILIIDTDGQYTTEENVDIKFRLYNIINDQWVYETGSSLNNTKPFNPMYNPTSIIYGSTDVYNYVTNSVFFSAPKVPPYIMDNQTLLQPLSQSVTQNSRTLLLCGVGILSLILLVGLFRKLYLFL